MICLNDPSQPIEMDEEEIVDWGSIDRMSLDRSDIAFLV
jgi:hypothetical protein